MQGFHESRQAFVSAVEAALPAMLPEQPADRGGLAVDAARYSLLSGGKRIRPVLLLWVSDMLGFELSGAMPYACALEMIHTYSLIHDDLPAMDNDDLRRGRPTCHKVYGEATAILAGDTLLNRAYEILLATVTAENPGSLEAARIIAAAAGSEGMIGGQSLDLSATGRTISAGDLLLMHRMKTGALLKAPVMAAASLAGADAAIRRYLSDYADAIGLGFQIRDDILDVTADSASLGKTAGKDQRDHKTTTVSLFGLEEAGRLLDRTLSDARAALDSLAEDGLRIDFLAGLTDDLLSRLK